MAEWLIVAAIALVLIGPKQMPAVVRRIARMMGKFQRIADEFKKQLMLLDREVEDEVASSFKDDSDEP